MHSIANETQALFKRTNRNGAVMGSKNLKAVAVRGTHTRPVHDRGRHSHYGQGRAQSLRANSGMRGLQEFGRPLVVESNQAWAASDSEMAIRNAAGGRRNRRNRPARYCGYSKGVLLGMCGQVQGGS